ncbi:hypothetical protein GH714_004530 [Hevea brasiliensis]|uniref:Uncharacterized protein n=1 Tax=Hevea brasiliensis TaxID=3981 RepID=A0A6A6KXL0_HEVBR|nr:hypothetical protein GH714_004530 [Hevea brasiliensis]
MFLAEDMTLVVVKISSDSSNVGLPLSLETENSVHVIDVQGDIQNVVDASNQRDMTVERILFIVNFLVEVPSAVLDQHLQCTSPNMDGLVYRDPLL